MPKVAVPITPDVLAWAISESGFSPEQVAAEAKVDPSDLQDWLAERAQPGVTADGSVTWMGTMAGSDSMGECSCTTVPPRSPVIVVPRPIAIGRTSPPV